MCASQRGQGALTGRGLWDPGRQVLYYMWTGRHPLDEYTRHFTIIREIGKGTRCVAHRRLPAARPSGTPTGPS
jgi:hypothetical protein